MTAPSSAAAHHAVRSIALFCRVIDNLGDAGVCWRLARQLATEHGCRVTLYIDAPSVLTRLLPADAPVADLAAGRPAVVAGVSIQLWPADPDWQPALAADLLIAAFGCELPASVRADLGRTAGHSRTAHSTTAHSTTARPTTARPTTASPTTASPGIAGRGRQPPLWVDLEYLSAEPWIDGANWLPSIKPSDGAVEHFVFPGFSAASAGLLRERGLLARRDAFRAAADDQAWLRRHRIERPAGGLLVSLFTYDSAGLTGRLAALADGPRPLRMLVPAGVATGALTALCGMPPAPGEQRTTGALTLHGLPWLEQDDYDRLLWSCDLNLVRGEDSWIRAHWAGRPMAWQPYPQADGAHLRKLDAWLARLLAGVDASLAEPVGDFLRAWAGARSSPMPATRAVSGAARAADPALAAAWAAFAPLLLPRHPAQRMFEEFALSLSSRPDLASSLLEFADRQARPPGDAPAAVMPG